ncbi:MAG: hypothetical protein HGA90_00055, partial [Alphaproteobacteria bacterium]|nr:hypothetical protein [Alphaproteobacteria bacterium]
MIDLPPLPFITPTTGSLPPNLSAESSPLTATVQILSLPEKLAEITRPIQINGALVSEVSNLTVTLRTPAGDMSLALPPSTDGKPNSIVEQLTSLVQNQKPVSLTIQPDGASLRASLLVPPSSLLAGPSRLSNLSPTKPTEAPGQPSTFTPGKIFTAIVLSADEKNDFGFFTSKASPPLQAENAILSSLGSNLQGKLSQAFLSIKSQVASTLGFTAVPEDETTQTLQPRPEPLAPRSETFSAKPGTELRFKISSIEPNSSPPSKELPSLSGNSVRATVVAKGTDGQIILNTGKTTLFARESADLPLGSQITLTLLPSEPETGLILSPEKALELPALRHLMASLGQIDPALAMNVLHNRIPQPNKTLSTTLLLLFGFLQDGNAKAWLGETAISRLGNAKKA